MFLTNNNLKKNFFSFKCIYFIIKLVINLYFIIVNNHSKLNIYFILSLFSVIYYNQYLNYIIHNIALFIVGSYLIIDNIEINYNAADIYFICDYITIILYFIVYLFIKKNIYNNKPLLSNIELENNQINSNILAEL